LAPDSLTTADATPAPDATSVGADADDRGDAGASVEVDDVGSGSCSSLATPPRSVAPSVIIGTMPAPTGGEHPRGVYQETAIDIYVPDGAVLLPTEGMSLRIDGAHFDVVVTSNDAVYGRAAGSVTFSGSATQFTTACPTVRTVEWDGYSSNGDTLQLFESTTGRVTTLRR
jgi:hypothetical protein